MAPVVELPATLLPTVSPSTKNEYLKEYGRYVIPPTFVPTTLSPVEKVPTATLLPEANVTSQ